MSDSSQNLASSPKTSPRAAHLQQAAWQIWLPLGLLLALFLAAAVLSVLFTIGYAPQTGLPDQQSPLASASVILLVSGTCLGSLLQLILLVGLVILNRKIITGVPGIANRFQKATASMQQMAGTISQKTTAPIISIAAIKAAFSTLLSRLQFWKNNPPRQ